MALKPHFYGLSWEQQDTLWMEHQSIESPSHVQAWFFEVGGNRKNPEEPTFTQGDNANLSIG